MSQGWEVDPPVIDGGIMPVARSSIEGRGSPLSAPLFDRLRHAGGVMLPAATLLMAVLLSAPTQTTVAAGAVRPIPASCSGFKIPPPLHPDEHRPYPTIDRGWPVDTSHAEIVKDERVAGRRSDYFAPVSIADVRESLTRYVVVSKDEWTNGFSHVAFGDDGGWLATETECFQWIVRPGGLAWIVYPDGTAVYLAGARPWVRDHR